MGGVVPMYHPYDPPWTFRFFLHPNDAMTIDLRNGLEAVLQCV